MKLCGFDVGLDHRFFLIAGLALWSPSNCKWILPAR
jgi:hypothetical protein